MLPAVALAAGLAIGVAGGSLIGPSGDEYAAARSEVTALGGELGTATDDLTMMTNRRDSLQTQLDTAEAEVAAAEQRVAELDAREAGLDTREAGLSTREAAVTATEQTIAANSVGNGTWTVGTDMQAGTYRTSAAVTSGQCYWSITVTGSNGGDIIENDIVTGGFPTVTVSEGQTFESNRCGTFVLQ
ncbi:hypothetical protein [Modestobacter sp. Leaf380]|uniref:hypothetical protein n=1 Tax=Modestobacter sp. Leaf380 TaxID=1736356 RepID=UPI0006F2CC32|nr:hypothetical protein [Modestobacter sp. Leaf380]KQS66112.1 hypothetical protein ASG41_12185 [Modestobacter sp. Leaf380]